MVIVVSAIVVVLVSLEVVAALVSSSVDVDVSVAVTRVVSTSEKISQFHDKFLTPLRSVCWFEKRKTFTKAPCQRFLTPLSPFCLQARSLNQLYFYSNFGILSTGI